MSRIVSALTTNEDLTSRPKDLIVAFLCAKPRFAFASPSSLSSFGVTMPAVYVRVVLQCMCCSDYISSTALIPSSTKWSSRVMAWSNVSGGLPPGKVPKCIS